MVTTTYMAAVMLWTDAYGLQSKWKYNACQHYIRLPSVPFLICFSGNLTAKLDWHHYSQQYANSF